MNANLVKYGIIAAAVVGATGITFGGYKGAKALARKRAAKKATRQAQSTISPMGAAVKAADAANGDQQAAA